MDSQEDVTTISEDSGRNNLKRPADTLNDTVGTESEVDIRPSYIRFKIASKEEQFQWTLPEGMATYVNDLFEKICAR